MSALQRWCAAYAIAGLSLRVSELHEIDRADYLGRHRKPT